MSTISRFYLFVGKDIEAEDRYIKGDIGFQGGGKKIENLTLERSKGGEEIGKSKNSLVVSKLGFHIHRLIQQDTTITQSNAFSCLCPMPLLATSLVVNI